MGNERGFVVYLVRPSSGGSGFRKQVSGLRAVSVITGMRHKCWQLRMRNIQLTLHMAVQ